MGRWCYRRMGSTCICIFLTGGRTATLHTTNAEGKSTTTHVSVARAPVASVIAAAFGTAPHAVTFEKFFNGSWDLQPAVGGASTDLITNSQFEGYIDVHYNSDLKRYAMIISNDTQFGYAESVDAIAIHWSTPQLLGTFGPIAAYPTAVGLGDDPHVLGNKFYVYYTHLPTDGAGWTEGMLDRFTVTCQ